MITYKIRHFVLTRLLLSCLLFFGGGWYGVRGYQATNPAKNGMMDAGIARVDITPDGPIRLAGYGSRKHESEGVLQKLEAKAIAFGSDEQGPSLLVSVDLIGIPGHVTEKLAKRISSKTKIKPEHLTIVSTHTHTGPEVGNLLNHFGEPLPPDQLGNIVGYIDQLVDKLERVSLEALENRSPAMVSWGQGEVKFAMNRRVLQDGKWTGFGVVPTGPVDHSMPLMKITNLDGKIRALIVNYACHGTTLGGDINKIHGDWMGEAQRIIEERHPDAVALITIGAGADANPEPRSRLEHTTRHGIEIADEVDRLLNSKLHPVNLPPVGRSRHIDLPYDSIPEINDLVQQANDRGARGYYARIALDRLGRGESIPSSMSYKIQTWTFGDDLAMIFLAGEVVVDYALRFKREMGSDRLWVNAYANDVPSYIPSRRVIQEGGYEVESSMYSYDRPTSFSEDIEGIIVKAVYELIPSSFKPSVSPEKDGVYNLSAENGLGIGPRIEYMPDWNAYGWFTAADYVEWEVVSNIEGTYNVYMEWSVSDREAGKPFIFEAGGDQKLQGTVDRTGSWESFKTKRIGTIQLSKGRHKMIFKPASHFDEGALLDLRGIKLIPGE